jgi:hypothetical protein
MVKVRVVDSRVERLRAEAAHQSKLADLHVHYKRKFEMLKKGKSEAK